MQVYHGSSARFDTFSYDQMGKNGTSEGPGFYFTSSKDVAAGYAGEDGYVFHATFKGKKPLNASRLTLSANQIRRYLVALHEKCEILWNYNDVAYYGLENVLNEAVRHAIMYNTSDVDVIGGLCNLSGDVEACLSTLYDVLGFDSIVNRVVWGEVAHTIYVALVNDVIDIQQIEKVQRVSA